MKRMKKKSLFKYDIKKKHNKGPLNAKEILEELEQNESFQVKKISSHLVKLEVCINFNLFHSTRFFLYRMFLMN